MDSAEPASNAVETNSQLLQLPSLATDSAIDYEKLPIIAGQHTVVSPPDTALKFQLHSYLAHFDGRFWCMWSQGPPVEDEPSQQVRFSTSLDGLNWSRAKVLIAPSNPQYAYIARGFWVRDGQLLALAAHFKGKGAFGVDKELTLQAFSWDKNSSGWAPAGLVFDNAINNFPPQRLPNGEWMMTRRDSRFNVFVLIGGQNKLDNWSSIPVVGRRAVPGFSPDEPIWWEQPDKKLVALLRDNGGSGFLFRSYSQDLGRAWSLPEKTNFPNATSKIFSLAVGDRYRVLISNAHPKVGRRELHLALSEDGIAFQRLSRLQIPSGRPSTLQYPHAIEHDGHVLIVFSRNKATIELFKIPVAEIIARQ